ncbi:hypothetical protein SAMN05421776_1123 [Nocardia farcinica]|uniref:Domain of uncharacterized function (DUF2825) n=1 Tax=Nocardia farcinica TaxID=37329 RepID=A0A0H5P3K9_NOCFR|nr:Domain of uncharacterised function (DUF2825) [Nocardia farcinica]SIT32055.1 hypothetical protein SAMN05421776_1123 [Nocardia farcinica]
MDEPDADPPRRPHRPSRMRRRPATRRRRDRGTRRPHPAAAPTRQRLHGRHLGTAQRQSRRGRRGNRPPGYRRQPLHSLHAGGTPLAGQRVEPSGSSLPRGRHCSKETTKPQSGARPRVRGEHCGVPKRGIEQPGSSPRARGALEAGAGTPASRGLIPACAGSTSTMCLACAICGAHPRVRGEHADLTRTFPVTPGSSPRARGAPGHGGRAASRTGLIPACAGSTPARCSTAF